MTALFDVDRFVDDFLRHRTGPTAPTTNGVPRSAGAGSRRPVDPCPPWCRLSAGHPYLAERPNGLRSRYHESDTLGSTHLGGGDRVEARMVADEYRTPSGQHTVTEPRIVLEGAPVDGLGALDAPQARALAGLLLQAADRLEGGALRAA